MANNFNYLRKAKFAPGTILELTQKLSLFNKIYLNELIELIVLEFKKINSETFIYKVLNKKNKQIQYFTASYLEIFSKQIGLVDVGNLKILFDDADYGFDASPPNPKRNPNKTNFTKNY